MVCDGVWAALVGCRNGEAALHRQKARAKALSAPVGVWWLAM